MQYGNFHGRPVTNRVRIGSDILTNSGKKGILTPDEQGYYPIPFGAYGTTNSAGMFYDTASGVSMFDPNSPLMRRLKKRVLYAEYKHPEPYEVIKELDGSKSIRKMTNEEYMARIRKIDDDRVCGHIRDLDLIDTTDEKGRPIKLVVGWVKPHGPFKQVLQDSLDNPNINTYFSVRSITQDDMMRGIKYTREISTWDMVGEGGILGACKYNAPALESFEETQVEITPSTLYNLEKVAANSKNIGFENADYLDTKELAKMLGWEISKSTVRKPAFMRR